MKSAVDLADAVGACDAVLDAGGHRRGTFFPLLFVSVWILGLLPPPTAADEAERVKRAPMSGAER